jgi:hypothetical protein
MGWLTDGQRSYRTVLLGGLVLAAMGALVPSHSPLLLVGLASLGNAAFHVGAGGFVLAMGNERASASGLFVGPGALGLGFGLL